MHPQCPLSQGVHYDHPLREAVQRRRTLTRTRVTPLVDTGGAWLAQAARINALVGTCLEILGYAPLDFGVQPGQIRAGLIRIEARSNHDRAAALRHFSRLGLTA